MNLQRAAANVQKKERRQYLQEKILNDIRNRGRIVAYTHKWLAIIALQIAFRRMKKEWRRRVQYAAYFQRVQFIVIRARIALQTKIKR